MSREQKKIVKSSAYHLLINYSVFFIGIINTFFIARLVSPEEWGILIFAVSFIGVVSYFCYLLPPGAEGTLQFYIPQLKNGNSYRKNEVRYFIFHIYKIRLFLVIVIFLIYLFIIHLLNLDEIYLIPIIIMSPTLILVVFENLNTSLLLAFLKFKKMFIVYFINILTYTLCNMLIFILNRNNPIEYIAWSYVISCFISFIISIIFTIPLIPRKDRNLPQVGKLEKKNYYEVHKKYGLYLFLSGITPQIIGGIFINFLYLIFGLVVFLTYLLICENIAKLSATFSGAAKSAYISIFSGMNWKENLEDYKKAFYQLNKYQQLIACIIVGTLFFFIELLIIIIYTEIYLVILIGVQFFLFTAFTRVIARNLRIITQSTNRTKIDFIVVLVQSIGELISVIFIILFVLGFITLLLFFFILRFLMIILIIHLINRKSEINLSYYKIFKPFLVFLLSLLIAFPFYLFFNFNLFLEIQLLNLFFNCLINTLVFYFIFYIIILISRFITKEEFNQILSIIPILGSDFWLIRKIAKLIEKLLPSRKA